MTDTNDDGIETKRPVKSIYDVSERRLNRYRLADLKTREAADIRAHEQLVSAEENLRESVLRYLTRGGTEELSKEIVHLVAMCYRREH